MKKLILILGLIFASCSTEDNNSSECNCNVLFQKRTIISNTNGNVISDSDWQTYNTQNSDIKDCSRNNEVVYTNMQSNETTIIKYRQILNCN